MSEHHVTKQPYTLKFSGLAKQQVQFPEQREHFILQEDGPWKAHRYEIWLQSRGPLSSMVCGVVREVFLFTEKIWGV